MRRFCVGLILLLTWAAGPILAHETTRSYLSLTRDGPALSANLRLAFRDIEVVVWLDDNLDGAVTWGEAEARLPVISTYVLSVLDLSAGQDCTLALNGTTVSESGGVEYLDLSYLGTCPSAIEPLQVTSRLFADIDPDHRLYLTVASGATQSSAILSTHSPTFTGTAQSESRWGVFSNFFLAGIFHLGGGFDHVVFLLMLMLPAVTVQSDRRQAVFQVVTAVTGFTLAHALTLTAASTNLLQPPTDLITVLVAASIVITALDNFRPFLPGPRSAVATFFGLIHGFGFATVLGSSAMTGQVFVVALFGFNLGIEVAQIGVVALTMFALMALHGGKVLLWLGSMAGGAAGLYWMLAATGLNPSGLPVIG